jgi:hypothetical protein
MFRSWFNLLSLGAEASQVVWLRSIKVAAGGPAAKREARRMVTEKVIASQKEGVRLAMGASPDSVVAGYRRRVKANIRRLSK